MRDIHDPVTLVGLLVRYGAPAKIGPDVCCLVLAVAVHRDAERPIPDHKLMMAAGITSPGNFRAIRRSAIESEWLVVRRESPHSAVYSIAVPQEASR